MALSAITCSADDSRWTPYVGADAGLGFVSSISSTLHNSTIDISFKPGATANLTGGIAKHDLSLGLEVHLAKSNIDEIRWNYQGKTMPTAILQEGELRQVSAAATVGYRLYSGANLSIQGLLSAGVLRQSLLDVQRTDIAGNIVALESKSTTWILRPSLLVGYNLGTHSSLSLRYAFGVSGEADHWSRLRSHSFTAGYTFNF